MTIFTSLKRFDAYTKPVEDFRERTVTGLDLGFLVHFKVFTHGQKFYSVVTVVIIPVQFH